jgi:hypothetical protein
MTANSKIFSTTLFGTSSKNTAEGLVAKNTATQELYLSQYNSSTLGTTIPKVPSNQRIMKD